VCVWEKPREGVRSRENRKRRQEGKRERHGTESKPGTVRERRERWDGRDRRGKSAGEKEGGRV
jgi:hypothetical protein